MIEQVEKLIVDWLKSDNENATYLAHKICVLLGDRLRIKLHLADVKPESYSIDIPFVPRKGDLIQAQNMIDEKNYTDEELDKIYSLIWSVWYVNWGKDKKGYFAEIVCEGD